jgi:ribosomal protein L23
MDLIFKPIVTEKSLALQSIGQYSFWVDKKSNKNQIANNFKTLFGVAPLSVRTTIIKGKAKTEPKHRQTIFKSDLKKVIITIPKDKKLEILTLKK